VQGKFLLGEGWQYFFQEGVEESQCHHIRLNSKCKCFIF
jgi:hypothetical protein